MKSDPKDCLYCQNNETLHNLMIEIAQLSVSRVFLFKEQTYRGRCLVAYKDHVNDLNELTDEERNAFMADVARVTRPKQKPYKTEKINNGAKSAKISRYNVWIPAVSALLIWQLDFSPIYVIILSGLGGFLDGRYKNKTQTDDGGNKA